MDVDIELKLLAGKPLYIPNAGFLYQATLGDIVKLGFNKYIQYVSYFVADIKDLINTNEINLPLDEITTLDLMLIHPQLQEYLGEAIRFFFKEELVEFFPDFGVVILGELQENLEDNRIISKENFHIISKYIKLFHRMKTEEDKENFNPSNKKAQEILNRIKKTKEIVNKLKEKKQSDITITDLISAVTAKSNNINKFNVWDLTYYQFMDEYHKLTAIDEYDKLFSSLVAGADSKKIKLKHWVERT